MLLRNYTLIFELSCKTSFNKIYTNVKLPWLINQVTSHEKEKKIRNATEEFKRDVIYDFKQAYRC